MSEEYNTNINTQGNDPEKEQETAAVQEEKKENSAVTGMEPGKAPTAENPYYAYSYKRDAENKEEKEKRSAEDSSTQHTGTQKGPYSSYHFSPVPPEPKSKKHQKKPMAMGKKFGLLVAAAAVFGIVAGGTFQAVNYVGDKMFPGETTKIESTATTQSSSATAKGVSTSQGGESVAEVAKNVMPSIVSITGISVQEIPNYFGFGTQQYQGQSSGSGIIVGQNDTELLIATNNHVVKDANSLTVCFTDQDGNAVTANDLENTSAESSDSSTELENGTAVAAQIKGTDSDNDLAVISVKLSDIPKDVLSQIKVATLGDSDSLTVGEQVVAIGNALGYGQSVTSGYVSALNKKVSSENANSTFIQTDAAINPGNSGGALLNMKGEVIGINSAKIATDEVEGMGFAIPISKAEPILDNLMSKKTREKVEDENKAAYLGITCKNVTSEASEMYNMPVGVFVDSVVENGPAEEAGLKAGDIIRKIDGTSVETYDNLVSQLEYYEAGEKIEFEISRADGGEYKDQTITVTLGAKKDAQTSTDNNSRIGNN
ncbi:MAG TPA: trypsin-like peptidase domain-containing protein [Candidatus Blautia stercoravium]|nr:trypsin-like peptidase domain-containing protein [Candidatus Blautia stercoravium]